MHDYHIHSCFSFDTNVSQQAMCQRAASLGLDGVCFTEHVDFHNVDGFDHVVDLPAYFQATQVLAAQWRQQLTVACGLEVGLQSDVHELNQDYLTGQPLDFIIGSIHAADRLELCGGDFCQGKSKAQAFGRYLEVLLEQVRQADYFHVLGHFDVIRRYCDYADRSFPLSQYQEITAEIFCTLIRKGKGIELNTGGLRCRLDSLHPDLATLRLYRSLGGEIVTVGSDAHSTPSIAWEFALAKDALRQAGFSYYSYFLQGQEYRVQIGA